MTVCCLNEDTLRRQHCVLRCCLPWQNAVTLLRAARTQEMFLKIFRNICVQDTKFVLDTNVARMAKRVRNIWETCSRQQCCHHDVSSFCRPLNLPITRRRASNVSGEKLGPSFASFRFRGSRQSIYLSVCMSVYLSVYLPLSIHTCRPAASQICRLRCRQFYSRAFVGQNEISQSPLPLRHLAVTIFSTADRPSPSSPSLTSGLFLLFQNYFRDRWNVFDFVIVLGSLLDFTMEVGVVSGTSSPVQGRLSLADKIHQHHE